MALLKDLIQIRRLQMVTTRLTLLLHAGRQLVEVVEHLKTCFKVLQGLCVILLFVLGSTLLFLME